MPTQKGLTILLRELVELLNQEAERNPDFAKRLDDLLSPAQLSIRSQRLRSRPSVELPDVYAELKTRGNAEFRLWLREQPIAVLRGVIRQQDLDATRRTTRWKEAAKLGDYIAEQLESRSARGSGFMRSDDRFKD